MVRKLRLVAAIGLAFMLAFTLVGGAVAAKPEPRADVLIGFTQTPGAAEEEIVRGAGGVIKYTFHLVPVIAASVPEAAISGLERNPNVVYVEPDGDVFLVDELANSWGVDRIDADLAWLTPPSYPKGAGVQVSIIDTGIDKDHPDLVTNIAGGVNYVKIKGKVDPDAWDDDNGHGTHVAGIVAADDNGIGVVGVAPDALLYGVKVLSRTGSGKWSDVIAGIQWSVYGPDGVAGNADDAEVINMSLGGGYSESVKAASDAAYAAGLILVAAAGNASGGAVIYPAAYDSVVAVSATDSGDNIASFSSVGPEVELAAPGVDIYSTYNDGGYRLMSGTSMASPHVSGAAALVWASGTYVTGSAVRTQLGKTAEDLPPAGRDIYFGYGLVDAQAAVATPEPAVNVALSTDKTDYVQGTTELAILTAVVSNEYGAAITGLLASAFVTTLDGASVTVTFAETGTAGTYTGNLDISGLSAGTHTVAVTVTDTRGLSGTGTATFNVVEVSGALWVDVTTDKATYVLGETVSITVTVRENVDTGAAVEGASVHVEITTASGWKYAGDGTTGSDGTVTFSLKTKKPDGKGTYSVMATASKSGWADGSDSTSFVVN